MPSVEPEERSCDWSCDVGDESISAREGDEDVRV